MCTMCWGRESKPQHTQGSVLEGMALCGRCAVSIRQAINYLAHQGYVLVEERWLAKLGERSAAHSAAHSTQGDLDENLDESKKPNEHTATQSHGQEGASS